MKDGLPPDAAFEADIVDRLMHCFASWGYERVKPPLMEFEDSLLSGPGEEMRAHTFRLMDPISQRMMGLRADMTPQVGRIAASRLGHAPRPLRLSYAGQVLRVKGEQMRPDRQIGQAGVELIGSPSANADAETVLLAAEALRAVGVANLSIDLNMPTLVPNLLRDCEAAQRQALILALDKKDVAEAQRCSGTLWPLMQGLLRAIGAADGAITALERLELVGEAKVGRDRLIEVARLVRASAPELKLTLDATDHRGFEYHSGVTFSILGQGVKGEFGRGGRYVNQAGENATGFTLYLDTLLLAVAAPTPARRVYIPYQTDGALAKRCRGEGWVTIVGLEREEDATAEARRLGCAAIATAEGLVGLDR
jgi:ATP phosphoribosyltransferase regulatory subunit